MTPISTTIGGTSVTLSTSLAAVNAILAGYRMTNGAGGMLRRIRDECRFAGLANLAPRSRLDAIPAGTVALLATGPAAPSADRLAGWLESGRGLTFEALGDDMCIDVLGVGLVGGGMATAAAEVLAGRLVTTQREREADLATAALLRAAIAG